MQRLSKPIRRYSQDGTQTQPEFLNSLHNILPIAFVAALLQVLRYISGGNVILSDPFGQKYLIFFPQCSKLYYCLTHILHSCIVNRMPCQTANILHFTSQCLFIITLSKLPLLFTIVIFTLIGVLRDNLKYYSYFQIMPSQFAGTWPWKTYLFLAIAL